MSRALVFSAVVALVFLAESTSALRVTKGDAPSDFTHFPPQEDDHLVTQQVIDGLKNNLHNHWNFLHPNSGVALDAVNGGGGCAACTLIIGLLEQVAQLKNETIDKTIGGFCAHIDPKIGGQCKEFFDKYGPTIIKLVENEFTGDEVCNAIKICKDTDGKKCRLFPPSHLNNKLNVDKMIREIRHNKMVEEVRASLGDLDMNHVTGLRAFNACVIVPQICNVANHLPGVDKDGDKFAPTGYKTLRGTYWRGGDCDDNNSTIYPGAAADSASGVDVNCNGISGVDPTDGKTYEEKFCANTGAQGTAILGDSATAHFAIPPQFLTASVVAKDGFKTYDQILTIAENELDWPMLSWSTGHMNTTQFHPDVTGPVQSVYLNNREANLCNNEDYQNLGVNGARSGKLKPFAELMGRVNAANPAANKPLQLWMAMIGNDVCNGHHTFRTMTPVAEYKANVKEAVLYADTILAPGSTVILVGLADGRILYDTMHARIHPIGSTNNDVTYKDVYDYLNCLHLNPCWGWLNSNATIRNLTSEHAAKLSATLPEIVQETQGMLQNIKVYSILDWITAISESPIPHWKLIEPVDGFHPSQLGNALLAEYFNNLTSTMGISPAVNPNNAAIKAQFGL